MYKILNIGGQDYKLEFSVEASLYADCVSGLTSLMNLNDTGIRTCNQTRNRKNF